MLNNEELKVAIVMMKRANCSGEESAAVAQVIFKLEALYNAQAQAAAAKPEKAVEKKEGKSDKKDKDK